MCVPKLIRIIEPLSLVHILHVHLRVHLSLEDDIDNIITVEPVAHQAAGLQDKDPEMLLDHHPTAVHIVHLNLLVPEADHVKDKHNLNQVCQ